MGIDRFMSEARALTNTIGNGVATLIVAKWAGALDEQRLHDQLNGKAIDSELELTARDTAITRADQRDHG
jgi:aerobic C4-dicarboxylate transport protein